MEFSVKRRLVIFLLLVSLLAPTAVFAEVSTQQRATKPSPTKSVETVKPSPRLPEANLISQVLPNGLEVIVL